MGKRWSLLATVLLGLLLITAGWGLFRSPVPVLSFETVAYVWQNAWTQEVRAAVDRSSTRFNGYFVLVGEVDGIEASLRLHSASVDWQTLSRTHRPVTLTLRANRGLLEGRSIGETVGFLAATLRKASAEAEKAQVRVDGVQLDYDCPTARLVDYALLVKALRESMHDTPLSVTALPTWLDSRAFKALIRETDHYVLQVHTLDKPTTVDAPIVLFDAEKLPARLERASRLRKPYFVALPTYGYRVAFDENGHFTALGAENAPALPNARIVMADPEVLAKVVATLRAKPPAWCRGIAWFRLPVDSDTLNWSWPALESVMKGKAPSTLPLAELRRPAKNLFELWLTNTAGYVSDTPVAVTVRWKGTRL
ncbi:MAG: DUF3142 domain-containing protein, partial [FCB group bacterium]|nr:DUF3142 domain-containing protein [FCB group bacterium]